MKHGANGILIAYDYVSPNKRVAAWIMSFSEPVGSRNLRQYSKSSKIRSNTLNNGSSGCRYLEEWVEAELALPDLLLAVILID